MSRVRRSTDTNPFNPFSLQSPLRHVWLIPLMFVLAANEQDSLVVGCLGLALFAAFATLLTWLCTGSRPWPTMKRLRQKLPWFEIQHVNRFDGTREPDLVAILEGSGLVVHEIDGRDLDSWSSMANALGLIFDRPHWPQAPRENVLATFVRAHFAGPRKQAVVIRNASVFATRVPGVLVELVAEVSQIQPNHARCVLLFLDLPGEDLPPPPAPTKHVARAQGTPHPWWRPQPGELTR